MNKPIKPYPSCIPKDFRLMRTGEMITAGMEFIRTWKHGDFIDRKINVGLNFRVGSINNRSVDFYVKKVKIT